MCSFGCFLRLQDNSSGWFLMVLQFADTEHGLRVSPVFAFCLLAFKFGHRVPAWLSQFDFGHSPFRFTCSKNSTRIQHVFVHHRKLGEGLLISDMFVLFGHRSRGKSILTRPVGFPHGTTMFNEYRPHKGRWAYFVGTPIQTSYPVGVFTLKRWRACWVRCICLKGFNWCLSLLPSSSSPSKFRSDLHQYKNAFNMRCLRLRLTDVIMKFPEFGLWF